MGYGTNFGNKISASMVLFAYVWVIANWPRSTIILLYIIFGLLAWLIYRLIIYPLAALLEGLLILIESKMCWHRRSIKQEVSEQLLWPNSWVNGIGDNQPPLLWSKGIKNILFQPQDFYLYFTRWSQQLILLSWKISRKELTVYFCSLSSVLKLLHVR